jgi:ferric-dicitrate binding protein FerR (iron transport regulator)
MNERNTPRLLDELYEILDQERQALIAGDLDRIAGFAQRKEALFEALKAADLPAPPDLEALQAKATRNQALFDASLAGIRSVSNRLAALRQVGSSLDVYNASGARQTVSLRDGGSLEKRA